MKLLLSLLVILGFVFSSTFVDSTEAKGKKRHALKNKAKCTKVNKEKVDTFTSYEMSLTDGIPALKIIGSDKANPKKANNQPFLFYFTYNTKNKLEKIECKDDKGNLVNGLGADWFACVLYKYDDNGLLISETYYDQQGMQREYMYGYSRVAFAYDENKKLTKKTFFNADRSTEFTGNSTSISAYQLINYDQKNRVSEITNYNKDGSLLQSLNMPTITHYEYDRSGKPSEIAYYNQEKKLGYNPLKPAVIQKKYDRRGNVTQITFFDAEKKLIECEEGKYKAAIVKYVYDKNNRVIEESYIGLNGKLKKYLEGSIIKYKYNKAGLLLEEAYMTAKGKYRTEPDYAVIKYKYDKNNKLIQEAFYKNNKVLCPDENGVAIWEYKYSKDGGYEAIALGVDKKRLFVEKKDTEKKENND